jgi:tRNA-dihydrouridine synthase
VATEAVKIAEQAGAVAVFIHGRTRSQGYTGPADWRPIAECKKVATSIKVIGNGDVFSPEAAMRMFDQTGCDGVLVSRGTLGEPWIVEDICRALKGLPPVKREIAEYKQALLDHLALSEQFKSEKGALIDMRKVCCWYLKNSFGARHMRAEASKIDCLASIRKLIENFHD